MLYLDHVFEEMHQSYMYSSDLTLREIRMKNARLAVRAISEEDLLLEKLRTLYLKVRGFQAIQLRDTCIQTNVENFMWK